MKIKVRNQSTGQITHVDENNRTAVGNNPAAASQYQGQRVTIGGRGVTINTISEQEFVNRMTAPQPVQQKQRKYILTGDQTVDEENARRISQGLDPVYTDVRDIRNQLRLDRGMDVSVGGAKAPTRKDYEKIRDDAAKAASDAQSQLDAMQAAWDSTAPQTGNTDTYYNPESESAQKLNEMIRNRRTLEAQIAQQQTLAENAGDMVIVDEIAERGDADLFNKLYVAKNAQTTVGMSDEERKAEAKNYDDALRALKSRGYTSEEINSYLASFTRWNDLENAEGVRQAINEIAKKMPVTASVASVVLGLATAPVAAVGSMILQSGRKNSPYQTFNEISQQTRETVGEKAAAEAKNVATALGVSEKAAEFAGKAAQWTYQAGVSMLESAIAMGTGGALGEALLGLNAATQTYNELLNSGLDNGRALASGVAAGIFEYTFEHVSLENLRALQATGKKGFFNAVLDITKQFLTEGSEEVATDIANELYDYMVNGGYSKYARTVADVIAKGGTEADAISQYASDLATQLFESGVVGGLSGAMGGGRIRGTQAVNRTLTNVRTGQGLQAIGTQTEGGVQSVLQPLSQSLQGTKEGEALSRVDGKTGAYKTGKAVQAAMEAYQAKHNETAKNSNAETIVNILTDESGIKMDAARANDVAQAYLAFMQNENAVTEKDFTTLMANGDAVDAINNAISNNTYTAVRELQKNLIEYVQEHKLSAKIRDRLTKWVDSDKIARAERHGEILKKKDAAIKNGESEKLVTEKAKVRFDGGSGEAQGIKSVDENGKVQIVVDDSGATKDLDEVKFADTYEGLKAREAYEIVSDMLRGTGKYSQKVTVEAANLMLGLALTSEAPAAAYLGDAYNAYTAGTVMRNRNTFMMDVEGGYAYLSLKDLDALYDQGKGQYRFKPGVVRIGTRKMTDAQQKEAQLLDRYFMDKGLTLVITDRLYDKDAAMLYGEANKNVIVVALASPRDNLIQLTVGHELFHWAKMQGGEVAREAQSLEDAVNDMLQQEKPEVYKEINEDLLRAGYTDEAIRREEIACQYFGTIWTMNAYAEQIAEDSERAGVWRKLLDHVKDFLSGVRDRIKAAFGHDKTVMEALQADVEDVMNAAEKFEHLIQMAAAQRKQEAQARIEVTEEQAEELNDKQNLDIAEQSQVSRALDQKMMNAAFGANSILSYGVLNRAAQDRIAVKNALQKAEYDANGNRKLTLPEDIAGKGYVGNASYGRTMEPTTICPRSVGFDRLSEMIAAQIGRPLNMEESLAVAQNIGLLTNEIQCLYCYVAADRMAYTAAINEFIKTRDEAYKLFKAGKIKTAEDFDAYYVGLKKGRVSTKQTQAMADYYVRAFKAGKELITAKELTTLNNENTRLKELREEFKKRGLDTEFKYIRMYAQSATWAEKRIGYKAYNGSILKWKNDDVKKLNEMFGLRFYSFSDYSPAFILDNMQAVTDAAVRGLKGLAYTKSTDFVKIFASTRMNINVSVFGTMVNGQMMEDDMQGANWDEVKNLRKQYDNVGAVFVATDDAGVEWALDQDWIDVVIPYHTVHAGGKVTEFYGWTDNKGIQEDRKGEGWNRETDARAIYPHQHQNDRETYLRLLAENHLTPRFEKWLGNDNYMKLVNETRRRAGDTPAMQPIFELDEALESIRRMEERGSYLEPLGGSIEAMQAFADVMADAIRTTDEADLRDLEVDSAAFAKRMSELKEAAEKTGTRQSRVLDQQIEDAKKAHNGTDLSYLIAIRDGRLDTARKIIEGVAREHGYNSPLLYHGTFMFGFTKINVANSDDRISFFATNKEETAKTYAYNAEKRNIGTFKQDQERKEREFDQAIKDKEDAINSVSSLLNHISGIYNFADYDSINDLFDGLVDTAQNHGTESDAYLRQTDSVRDYLDGMLYDAFEYLYAEDYDEVKTDLDESMESQRFRDAVEKAITATAKAYNSSNFESLAGIYELYANEDNLMVIDGMGRNWNDIPLGKHLIDFNAWFKNKKNLPKDDTDYLSASTRDIAQYAYDKNFDGVKFKNIVDNGGHGERKIEPSDVYAFFNPMAQVKSAETEVYDDDGTLILPSERFNPEQTDIRYSRVLDQEYMDAVDAGDINKQKKMVEKAARDNGYNSPLLYHGTPNFGFTSFDTDKSQNAIFATTSKDLSETYVRDVSFTNIKEADDFSKLTGNDLLFEANRRLEFKYADYRLLPKYDETKAKQKILSELETTIRNLENLKLDRGMMDVEKHKIKELVQSLKEADAADTEEAFKNALGEYLFKYDGITNSYFLKYDIKEAIDNAMSRELYTKAVEYLHEYRGERYGDGNNIIYDRALRSELKGGRYSLYGKLGRALVLDARGGLWRNVKMPKSFDADYKTGTTREVAAIAFTKGYDSVVIKNLLDSGGEGKQIHMKPEDIYIFKSSDQIKSADPVTYDDEGNVIPLSERFNPEKTDIRYSRAMATDAEYEDAVKRGDMEAAQEMVDQRAYTKNYVAAAYHGTPNGGFTVFNPTETRNGADAPGVIWFAEEKRHADVYRRYPGGWPQAENPMTYHVYLDIGRTVDIGNGRVEALDYSRNGDGEPSKDLKRVAKQIVFVTAYYHRNEAERTRVKRITDNLTEIAKNISADFVWQVTETKAFADLCKAEGLDSVIAWEEHREFGEEPHMVKTWGVFDSSQIKSAEPATYDDDGNLIPLSKRFDKNETDIRHSRVLNQNAVEYVNRLKAGSRELWEMIDVLEDRATEMANMREWAGQPPLDRKALERIARRYNRSYDKSRTHIGAMALRLEKAQELLKTGMNVDTVLYGLYKIAEEEWTYAGRWETATSDITDFKKELRYNGKPRTVYLSESDYETLAAGRGGRHAFRKEYFNKLNFTTDDAYRNQGFDVFYDELQGSGMYALPDVHTPSEQWAAILRLYQAAQDKVLVETAEELGIVGETLTERATTDAFSMLRDLLYDSDKIRTTRKRVAEGKPMSPQQWALIDEADRLDRLQAAVEDERRRGVQSIITQADAELQKRLEQLSRSGKSTVDVEVERERLKAEARVATARQIYNQRAERLEQRYKDNAEKEALRADIKRNLNAMVKLFTKESDSAHVPQALKRTVLQFLRMFDKDRTLITAANMHNLYDFSRVVEATGDNMAEAEYQEFFGRFDEGIKEDLQALESRITVIETEDDGTHEKRRRVYTSMLTTEDMRVLSNAVEHIRYLIDSANEAWVDGKRRKISTLGDRLMADAKAVTNKSKLKNIVRNTVLNDFANVKMLTPIYFFEEKIGSSMKEVYEGFRNAQDEWYKRAAEGKYNIQAAKEKYEYNKWKDKTFHFSFPEALRRSAWDVDLSAEAMMQIYVTLRREQSSGKESRHLMEGGVVLGEELRAGKGLADKLKGLRAEGARKFIEKSAEDAEKQANATRHMLSYDELMMIVNHKEFTQQMKDYADTIVDFMSTDVSKWGNGATMQLAGIRKFNEKYYFPFVSAKDYLYTRLGVSDDTRLKNAGFTKPLQWNAKNPLVIDGFTNIAANHIQQMALYSTMTVPIDTLQRLINYAPVTIDEEGHQHLDDEDNVKTAIKNAYGKGAMTYINNFVTQVNGGIRPDPLDNLWNKGTAMFKRAAVMGNASVVIQQPTALMRAMAMINPKYFFGKATKEDFKDMMGHAPVAGIKVMGGFDTMTGRGAADWMIDEKTNSEKLTEAFGKGAELADNATWTNIWNACKRETRDKHPNVEYGSDEFYEITYKRFRDICDYTQVYDSTLSKNELMRGTGSLTKMVTAFMAEPSLSFNLITQSGKGRTIHKGRALGAFITNIIVNSMFRSIVAGWRDKDDDQTYLEKWLEHFVSDLVGDKTVGFLDGAWSPLGMLPWVKDIISIWDGYSVDRADVSAISDLIDSVKAAMKAFDNYDGTAKSVDFEALVELAGAISNLTPAPLSKVMQDILGIEQTITNARKNPMKTTWETAAQAVIEGLGYDVKRADKAYDAVLDNNVEYIRRVTAPDQKKIEAYVEQGYSQQEAQTRAANDATRSWYDTVADGIISKDARIMQAAQARWDLELNTYEALVRDMIDDGLPEYAVLKAIEKLYAEMKPADVDLKEIKDKTLYKNEDLEKALENNDVNAFNRIKEELMVDGTKEDTIINKAVSYAASYLEDTGDDRGAKQILMKFAGYGEREADKTVGYWQHKDAMTSSQWTTYYDKVASTGITTDVYMDYVERAAACEGVDKNGDGKADSGTKKKQLLEVINDLPISKAQKDALYRLNNWAESKLNEAPWH